MSSVWSSLRGRQKRVENKGMNNRYREKKHYSVLPYYVIGASWIAFALLFPMYTVGHYVVIALISVAEFVILRGIIPPKIERIALPYEPPKTGIADVDDTMELGAEYIRKFDEIGGELYAVSPALSDKLADIRELMSTIFEYVAKNPDGCRGYAASPATICRRSKSWQGPTSSCRIRSCAARTYKRH